MSNGTSPASASFTTEQTLPFSFDVVDGPKGKQAANVVKK